MIKYAPFSYEMTPAACFAHDVTAGIIILLYLFCAIKVPIINVIKTHS